VSGITFDEYLRGSIVCENLGLRVSTFDGDEIWHQNLMNVHDGDEFVGLMPDVIRIFDALGWFASIGRKIPRKENRDYDSILGRAQLWYVINLDRDELFPIERIVELLHQGVSEKAVRVMASGNIDAELAEALVSTESD